MKSVNLKAKAHIERGGGRDRGGEGERERGRERRTRERGREREGGRGGRGKHFTKDHKNLWDHGDTPIVHTLSCTKKYSNPRTSKLYVCIRR